MNTHTAIWRGALAGVCTAALAAAPATATASGDSLHQPNNSSSDTVSLPNGHSMTGNVWIQTFSDSGGCGDYATSAIATTNTTWIQNTTTATAHGVGATVSGLSGGGADKSQSITWRNTNASGSYLSGRVCANWLTWYVSMDMTGVAYYYGTVRTVGVSV